MQIPGARLEICFWIEKSLHVKIVNLAFARPFVGRFFAHLHQPALSGAAVFLGIEPAFAPNDCLHQHRIEIMFRRHCPNQAVVLLKPCRTDPFIHGVNWIARSQGEISEARGQREQQAKNQFEEKSDHERSRERLEN